MLPPPMLCRGVLGHGGSKITGLMSPCMSAPGEKSAALNAKAGAGLMKSSFVGEKEKWPISGVASGLEARFGDGLNKSRQVSRLEEEHPASSASGT